VCVIQLTGAVLGLTFVRVYGWVIEGFDTQDLKDAKALLDELDTGSSPDSDRLPRATDSPVERRVQGFEPSVSRKMGVRACPGAG
jgi:hypothetical protein